MSKRKEKISAFLDNDLHRDELMSFSLSGEAADAEVAQRYQLVGDAIRGELSDASFVDVSQAVREALANENIADLASPSAASVSEPNTSNTNVKEKSSSVFDLSSWFRPVAGMAVAASVAVVLVTSFSEQSEGLAPIANNVEQQPSVQIAVDNNATVKPTVGNQGGNQERNANPYITQHLEFATQDTLQGRLPYVRAVSFESTDKIKLETNDSSASEAEKTK